MRDARIIYRTPIGSGSMTVGIPKYVEAEKVAEYAKAYLTIYALELRLEMEFVEVIF